MAPSVENSEDLALMAAARTYLPKLLAVAKAAKRFTNTPTMEPWDAQTEADFRPLVEALRDLES